MSKTVIEFTKEELKELLDDEDACVSVQNSVYSLALFPYHLGDFRASIKQILNARVAKYEKRLGGILLGYKNVKLLTSEGTIVTDSCHIHIDINADFYIFKPKVGCTLKGVVNKKSGDHVGCLVHRTFNMSVPKRDKNDDWIGYFVEIGQEVVLNVTHIDLHARLPYIRAEFDEENFVPPEPYENDETYKNEIIENNTYEDELVETPVHKKKKSKSNISELINSYEESEENTPKKKKNKRKSKEFIEENDTEVIITKKKKKKDKNKELEIEIESNSEITSNKYIKNEENLKKKRHSELLDNTLNDFDETIVSKKKSKKRHRTQDLESEENKESTPINNNKIEKEKNNIELKYSQNNSSVTSMADAEDRKSKKKHSSVYGNVSWENIVLNLCDSELEKTLSDLTTKEKKKKKKSINDDSIISEEPNIKKRKRDDEITEEERPVKKHKSKKKRQSIDIEDQI